MEGNILVSASILPWTAKLLGLESVDDLLELAKTANGTNGVSLVPALVGLGSPHWNSHARGLISGLSFGSGREHIALAAAESMAFQVLDVFSIIYEAIGSKGQIFVDGGPSGNSFLYDFEIALMKPKSPFGKIFELPKLKSKNLC